MLKALVPFVPLVVLFLTSPTLNILKVPISWLADPGKKAEVEAFDSRLIGAAMLVGVLAAALTAPRTIRTMCELPCHTRAWSGLKPIR